MNDNIRSSRARSRAVWVIAIFFALIWTLVAAIPFIFMIINSMRGQGDMLQHGVFTLPDPWIFTNYPDVISRGFFGYFMRSVIVVGVSLTLLLMITAFAAYPLSRMRFKLRLPIRAFIIAMMSVPIHVTLIPIFKMSKDSGLYDTIWALVGSTWPSACRWRRSYSPASWNRPSPWTSRRPPRSTAATATACSSGSYCRCPCRASRPSPSTTASPCGTNSPSPTR